MDKAKRMNNYLVFFRGKNEGNFKVNQQLFNKSSSTLVHSFNKWLKSPHEKKKYIEHFSSTSWVKFSTVQTAVHTLSNSKASHMQHQPFQEMCALRSHCLNKLNLTQTATNEIKKNKDVKPKVSAIK
mgnify:CR=1 FL=1